MDQPVLLEMSGICKEFPGVKALDHVNLTVRPGTVHALMGENGAGKSTLMKCLFGIYHRDAGTIVLDGISMRFGIWRTSIFLPRMYRTCSMTRSIRGLFLSAGRYS